MDSPTTCDEFLLWIPLRPGDLEPGQQAALDLHAEACPSCRTLLGESRAVSARLEEEGLRLRRPFLPGAARRAPPPLRHRRLWATAAAAVMLLWFGLNRPKTPPAPERPSPARPVGPARSGPPSLVTEGLCRADSGDLEGVVGRSIWIALRQGGSLRVSGRDLELLSGALVLDTPGEEAVVRIGPVQVILADAAASLEIAASPAPTASGSWMTAAEASDGPDVLLAATRGSLEVVLDGKRTALRQGNGMILRGGSLIQDDGIARSSWRPVDAWIVLPDTDRVLQDSATDLLPAPLGGGYVVEALVRKREAMAELGVRLAADKGVYEFPVGPALDVPDASERGGAWTRIRMERRGDWFVVQVGGSRIVSCSSAGLERAGQRVDGRAVGLRSWGGDIQVTQARWKAVPP